MSQRTQTILTDDLTKTEGAQTVTFTINGQKRDIDLTPENQEVLNEALNKINEYVQEEAGKFLKASRPAKSKRTVKNADTPQVREWAKAKGYNVGERGRIRHELIQEYRKEQAQNA